ncbi:MAG TPA: AI-2E family transporter [Ignavibacteria bacterium]|nr:AI-2E family transporter [Ignavibacteria bacterium]HMR40752.1 AI-2E family transporter [Ignavibacteria bacterium]
MSEKNPNSFLNFVAALFLMGFLVFVLIELQSILLPLFIALIISLVFMPLYRFLNSKKIPSAISIVIIILIIILVSNVASVFIFTSMNTFSSEFPKYEQKVIYIFDNITKTLNISESEVQTFSHNFNIKSLLAEGKLTATITNIFSGVTALMGNYILILFYIIFILSESNSIKRRISRAFSEEKKITVTNTLNDIFRGVKDYISGKTLLSLSQAVVIGLLLWICGVDFYFIWAFLFFITDFIPNVGSLIASILVAIVMYLQFDNFMTPTIILVVLIVIQNVKGNIIEPKIFGAKLDLSPLLLLFSLIFWGYVWGIMGMILSVPIMSMIKITFINIPATKPIGILMSNNADNVK